jgi:hypothetical protein
MLTASLKANTFAQKILLQGKNFDTGFMPSSRRGDKIQPSQLAAPFSRQA